MLRFCNATGKDIFFADGYKNSRVVYHEIVTEIIDSKVKDLLWIGVDPYNLLTEYLLAKQGISMTTLKVGRGGTNSPFECSYID